MKSTCTSIACITAWLTCLAIGLAQEVETKISSLALGLSSREQVLRLGKWCPVYVDIELNPKAVASQAEGYLIVETEDADGGVCRTEPLHWAVTRQESIRTYLTYIKPSGWSATVTAKLLDPQGREIARRRTSVGAGSSRVILPSQPLILCIGSASGLQNMGPLASADPKDRGTVAAGRTSVPVEPTVVEINNLADLPHKWLGYDGVDAIVLPTGKAWQGSIAQALANDPARRQALVQYVELGGHLIVSVAANAPIIARESSFPIVELLPAQIDPQTALSLERLDGVEMFVKSRVAGTDIKPLRANKPDGTVPVARLAQLPPGTRFIVSEKNPTFSDVQPRIPVVVERNFGLGRVTLVGFDTDIGPFSTWENNNLFWRALFQSALLAKRDPGASAPLGILEELPDAKLQNWLERFPGVSTVGFGWVALFVLVYLVLAGPIEYVVLRKLGKLEWTWVTFPTLVGGACVLAYFLAVHLKGNQLWINKVDIIDVDADRGRLYGTTWFSLFSPQFRYYDLSVEPLGTHGKPDVLLTEWFGTSQSTLRGVNTRRTATLFSRAYSWADQGAKLERVPISVWTAKSFCSRWAAASSPRQLFTSELVLDGTQLTGKLRSHLPAELDSCYLIFRDRVWDLRSMKPNEEVLVDPTAAGPFQKLGSFSPAFPGLGHLLGLVPPGQVSNPAQAASALYAYLDQRRRLQADSEEAILIGRVSHPTRRATGPSSYSEVAAASGEDLAGALAEKSWGCRIAHFGTIPNGKVQEETWLRAYLPIRRHNAAGPWSRQGGSP
ncbi:MAG: hypothetical protein C4297_13330 [Gemmataceae bacterium]